MRDINRIQPFFSELEKYWKDVPDWRFGQLLVNVLSTANRDLFFYEDDEFLKLFEDYFKKEV